MIEKQIATQEDLQAINRFTLREMKPDDVYIFSAKFIDSEVTANKREWTKEWQKEAVERRLFDGVSFLMNHENDQTQKIGTVFSATLQGDSIVGKVFIPLDEQGKRSMEAVENSRISPVSINADGEIKREGDRVRVLPSKDMRVYEVSAVAVGGCRTCKVLKESACSCGQKCSCQSASSENVERNDTSLLEFARGELTAIKTEFVRLAGLSLSINDRPLLESVASSIDPKTLKQFSAKLREHYLATNKSEAAPGSTDAHRIAEALSNIRKVKGV